jgi:5-methylcytosine-specific restriction endonuclease McrA
MQKEVIRTCKKHGDSLYVLEKSGYYRCKKCRSQHVIANRRRAKEKLIEEFGGKCCLCGYCKCRHALQFHHINAAEKKFGISDNTPLRSYHALQEEAKKCILVCANCHAEIEAGITECPMV